MKEDKCSSCCCTDDIILCVLFESVYMTSRGWSGGAKVLGKLQVPGRPTILITVGQGPTALAVGAGGGCLDIFTLIYLFSSLSPSLWETARYRLKYCLKGPLNPKQPTNQIYVEPINLHRLLWQCQKGSEKIGRQSPIMLVFPCFLEGISFPVGVVGWCDGAW